MKHSFLVVVLLCLLLGLTGCRLNDLVPDDVHDFLDGIVENIGSCQLTEDEALIGTRTLTTEDDSYAGEYTADCDHVTGRDVVFGGTSIDTRVLRLAGRVETASGEAKLRIRMNDETMELKTDADGCFETELKFISGGNYIMVLYEDFAGTVEMTCEYADGSDTD